ncbi:MAG: spermidine synthase [Flavobacteriales bacterium]
MRRLFSWIWPIVQERAEGRHGPIEARWENGRLVLNTPRANQSLGSLHRVWRQVFAWVGLRKTPPANVLLLGLGAGSVPRILRHELRLPCPITAIEIDPAVIAMGRRLFGLGAIADLEVIEGDAIVAIHALRQRYELVLVDLFDDADLARGIDTAGFARALRDRCAGMLCFNTMAHDTASAARCDKVKAHLARSFGSVDELRLEGVNRVFVARCSPRRSD